MANELPTKNFLTRIQELKLETGSTGAARFRKIPLYVQETAEAASIAGSGNFTTMTHITLANAQTDIAYYWGVVVPSDLVPGSIMRFRYMFSVSSVDDTIDWVITVRSVRGGSSSVVALLSDTTSVAAPSSVNTMSIRKLDFTLLPEKEDVIFATIQRTSGDTNTGSVQLWNAWIEYLAHS